MVSLIVVGLVVFSPAFPGGARGYPLAFLCMPLLVWAAFRFDLRFASVVVLVLAITAVIGITRSTGMDAGWDLNQRLLVLQLFLGVAAVKTLALAAMVEERRRVESAVLASSEELQEAMTELEAFHRSISHDLRSPVGAVINYSAVIEEDFGGRLDDEGLRLLRRIRASAGSAANLLDQLVQFGWARSNRVERHPVDMTSIARDVQSEILASGVDAGNVKFELQVLPPAWGSAELLRCVFRNLFSNALKFSGGRRVRHIQVSGRAGAVENTYSVSDNGVGFDPGLGLTMFKPFIRGRETGGTEGSGLGLAIVARIVEKHRGRVWAESDGSSGAQVCFTLPSARID